MTDLRAFRPVPLPPSAAPSRYGWNDAHRRCHGLVLEALDHVVERHEDARLSLNGLDGAGLSLSTPDADVRMRGPDEDQTHPEMEILVSGLQDMPLEITIPVLRWNPHVVRKEDLPLLAATAARNARDQFRLVESTLNNRIAAEDDLARWAQAHLARMIANGTARTEDRPAVHLHADYADRRPRLRLTSNGLTGVDYVAADARPIAPPVEDRRSFRMSEDAGGDAGPLRSVHLHALSAYASSASLPESPVELARRLREFDLPDLRIA